MEQTYAAGTMHINDEFAGLVTDSRVCLLAAQESLVKLVFINRAFDVFVLCYGKDQPGIVQLPP